MAPSLCIAIAIDTVNLFCGSCHLLTLTNNDTLILLNNNNIIIIFDHSDSPANIIFKLFPF
jgi:hypothetical protein